MKRKRIPINIKLIGRIKEIQHIYNYGIYLIINHTTKEMYIGMTEASFACRWNKHIEYPIDENFINHSDTRFCVLETNIKKHSLLRAENRHMIKCIRTYKDYHLYNNQLNSRV